MPLQKVFFMSQVVPCLSSTLPAFFRSDSLSFPLTKRMWSPGLLQKSPLMRSVYRISCSIFILLSFVGELVIGNPVYFAQRKISAVYHKPENSKWSEVGYLKPVILTSLVVGVVALSVMGRSYWANPVSPGITSAILGTPLRDVIFAAPSQQGITSLVNYWPLALGMIPITGLGLRGIGRLCFREGHPASSSISELPVVVPALTKGDEAEVIVDEKRKRQSLVVEEIVVDTTRASDAMTASVRKKPPDSDHSSPTAPPAVIVSPVTPAGVPMPVLTIPEMRSTPADGSIPPAVIVSPVTPAGVPMPVLTIPEMRSTPADGSIPPAVIVSPVTPAGVPMPVLTIPEMRSTPADGSIPPAVIVSPVTPAGVEMPIWLPATPKTGSTPADGAIPPAVIVSPATPAGAEMPENSLRLSKSKEPRHRTESPPSPSLFSSKK